MHLVVRQKTSTPAGNQTQIPWLSVSQTSHYMSERYEDILKQSDLNRVQNEHFGELYLNQPGKQLEQPHTQNSKDFSKFFTL